MTGPASRLDVALDLAARSWRVFPLRPDAKAPAVRDWERRATVDPARIRRCWAAGSWNIGVATGPSGLVVVDLDTRKPGASDTNWGAATLAAVASQAGATVPATYTVHTGRGGRHLYYTAPASVGLRNAAGALGPLVDTRAHGGYVVAAGSVVAGRPYTVLDDRPPTALPPWLATRLTTAADDAAGTAPRPTLAAVLYDAARRNGYIGAAYRGELDRVLAARPGGRNHALNTAAYSLGQLVGSGLLDTEDVTAALIAAARAAGLGPAETTDTIRSGLTAGRRNPRKVPA